MNEIIADALFTMGAALNRIAEALEEQNRLTAQPPKRSESSDVELDDTA
jgi:hypothetical protein